MATRSRIFIFGASGSGTTTLGKALAEQLGIAHLDSDDFFWEKAAMPYSVQRAPVERTAMLKRTLEDEVDWVLSGDIEGWGDFAIPMFTLAVFLRIPSDLRMRRLQERETSRFGRKALSPDGWMHKHHRGFMDWAAKYDTGGLEIRSLALHTKWMRKLSCTILKFEEPMSIEEMVNQISSKIERNDNVV